MYILKYKQNTFITIFRSNNLSINYGTHSVELFDTGFRYLLFFYIITIIINFIVISYNLIILFIDINLLKILNKYQMKFFNNHLI